MEPLDAALERTLLSEALRVREQTYAPYSRFAVGAALLASSGKIYVGCNVENASYGLCICAERNAIAAAIAAGERTFRAIAVVGGDDHPATPCGACRQVLVEFSPSMHVLMAAPGALENIQRATPAELLPHYFSFGSEQ
jgi:cytidine deaminase